MDHEATFDSQQCEIRQALKITVFTLIRDECNYLDQLHQTTIFNWAYWLLWSFLAVTRLSLVMGMTSVRPTWPHQSKNGSCGCRNEHIVTGDRWGYRKRSSWLALLQYHVNLRTLVTIYIYINIKITYDECSLHETLMVMLAAMLLSIHMCLHMFNIEYNTRI